MSIKDRASVLRREICRQREHLDALINDQLKGISPMIQGSLYTRRRKCGKLRCRCASGRLHQDRVLAILSGGRVKLRGLDPDADATMAIEDAVAAWRGFRRQRGELAAACRSLLRIVDRLARLRLAQAGSIR